MSDEGEKRCPLCTEDMDFTDQQLKPCKCGYEICVWCWHHIMDMAEKDDTEGRCPACRTPYDKEKIVGMAATNCERLVAEINSERKMKSQKVRPKTASEGRKQLSSVRVIQRHLVYIMGIPSSLADEDVLERREYFGQYGKVVKVSMSRTAGGAIQYSSTNTCSVYITYSKEEEAVRCIQSVHGFVLEGKPLRACFGTTKYCHAWLRNVPCSNPDCLYLHDIGTQEDSFTKDEIISAYTRSRVQQITGAINNLQRRSGNVLPPPADEYCNTGSPSSKPILKSASNNPASQARGSPPNDSSVRSIALPPAASWVTRVSSGRPPATNSVPQNGPSIQNPDTLNSSFVLPPVVASPTQTSTLHSDIGNKSRAIEESSATNFNDQLQSSKQYFVRDCRAAISDSAAEVLSEAPATITSSNQWSCLSASRDEDNGSISPPSTTSPVDLDRQSCTSGPHRDGNVAPDGSIESLCSGFASLGIDGHLGSEQSDAIKPHSLVPNHLSFRSPGNQELQQHYVGQSRDPPSSLPLQKYVAASDGAFVSRQPSDWTLESEKQVPDAFNEAGEDLLAFDDQRVQVSEVASRTSYLPHASNSLKISNDSYGNSWEHIDDACSTSNPGYTDPGTLDTQVDGACFPYTPANPILPNGYNDNKVSSSVDFDKSFDSNLFSNVGKRKYPGRFNDCVAIGDKSLDMGESSIISDILSLDVDTWDDSLTSPHNLVKLLNENDKNHGSLKISSAWKAPNNNQSRFSFARQKDFSNQGTDLEPSFSNMGFANTQDSVETMDPFLDKLQKGFSSSRLEESDTFSNSHSVISSNKLSVSRPQFSAPPGFSVPNRAPPPGFSSQERMDPAFDTITGNHLLQNSSSLRSQYLAPPTGNFSSVGDVEFIDPAILEVGKGRLPNGINNLGLDMRSTYPPQLSASENDARLQLLMQQSVSSHQNMRFSDHIGDRFSPLNDAYIIPSRHLEQSQASNLSSFAQLSLQQSRNGHMPNGHWDGWNDFHTGNDSSMAELLRNERRLGLNNGWNEDQTGNDSSMAELLKNERRLGLSNGWNEVQTGNDSSMAELLRNQRRLGLGNGWNEVQTGNDSNMMELLRNERRLGLNNGWNEVQTGNDSNMAELLRNERLGLNKFFPGYEDLKFPMPNSGNLYNRAFGM